MKLVTALMTSLVGMTLIFFLAGTAEAQTSDRFPAHTTIIVDGQRYEGFDLGGFQELLRMDADLYYYTQKVILLEAQLDACNRSSQALYIALNESMSIQEELRIDRDRVYSLWEDENRRRLRAENAGLSGGMLPWTLAGTFGVTTFVLTGIAIGMAARGRFTDDLR